MKPRCFANWFRIMGLSRKQSKKPAWFKSDVFRVTLRTLIGPAVKRVHAS
jgi:hypothetical protein